jgi:hypothetical protein
MRAPRGIFSRGAPTPARARLAVQPLHVAAWIERQTQTSSAPTVKQQLAAIRHLFDWLVVGPDRAA